MEDVEGTVQFLALLSATAVRLSAQGRAVFDIQYNGLSFGNWVMTAGSRKRRVRLTWDGKEHQLAISTAAFADSQSRPQWTAVEMRSLPSADTGELLGLAEELILQHSLPQPTEEL
jgi:hypothetical protein